MTKTFRNVRQGRHYKYSSDELRFVQYNRQRMIVGTPDMVKEKIQTLAKDFEVDEVVIATFADTAEDRLQSYELLAEIFALKEHQAGLKAG